MILLTGATGTVGREVARRLPAGSAVRIMARDPRQVPALAGSVQVVRGDYEDGYSLARALLGVRSAFLVTTSLVGDHDARFLSAARSAGVRHVVKLSAAAVEDGGAQDRITRWQRENERALRECGMQWTVLRPRSFMSNTLAWAASVRTEQVVRALYGSSANAVVDPRDVAEVAVRVLTCPGHEGRAHTLTGPQALTAVQQTAQLAALLGRPLTFEELDRRQARAALRTRYPDSVVEALLQSAERQQAGAKSQVNDTVREVTGTAARSFRQWAQDHLASFVAEPHA
jgi:uncharacterized protein YbjT (DUF2867 family)